MTTKAKNKIKTLRSIIDRAVKMNLTQDRFSLAMDLDHVDLDIDKLSKADNFNFAHDILGIINNMNRTTGQLENCFFQGVQIKKAKN